MTTQLVENKCDGGQWTCSPPKECCKQGCCFLFSSSIYKGSSTTSSLQPGSVFNPLFLGHWYFWLAVTATVAGILCACSLWRKHNQGSFCCKDSSNGNRDERASEPDSNGSCYAPPQYSRCNSFHQAPPPYSEVTSKPDLYPLVISYNAEPVIKSNNSSTGYLMVQYFRNFIVRPVGSLSATSTIDSLSSSFLCNATNEANSIIPPPYSHMASLEDITTTTTTTMDNQLLLSSTTPNILNNNNFTSSTAHLFEQRRLPRSASSCSHMEYHQVPQASPSIHSRLSMATTTTPSGTPTTATITNAATPTQFQQRSNSSSSSCSSHQYNNHHQIVSITDNPCFDQNATGAAAAEGATSSTITTNNILLLDEEDECISGGRGRRRRSQQRSTTSVTVPNEAESPTIIEATDTSKTGRVESKCQIINCDASTAVSSKINYTTTTISNNNNNNNNNSRRIVTSTSSTQRHKLSKDDSESQDDDHNFSDLLNLSVCVPSTVVQLENPIQSSPHLQELQYSVTNSIGSDISSLANLGSPDSPPRATSPTLEMKELLDKIQQLPQQKSPIPLQQLQNVDQHHSNNKYGSSNSNNRNYFHKVRAKTLYMPLCDEENTSSSGSNFSSSAKLRNIPNVFSRGWLSRSAPCTPSSNFVPNFAIINHHHQLKGSKTKITDGSPLLKEHAEESEDDEHQHNKDEENL